MSLPLLRAAERVDRSLPAIAVLRHPAPIVPPGLNARREQSRFRFRWTTGRSAGRNSPLLLLLWKHPGRARRALLLLEKNAKGARKTTSRSVREALTGKGVTEKGKGKTGFVPNSGKP